MAKSGRRGLRAKGWNGGVRRWVWKFGILFPLGREGRVCFWVSGGGEFFLWGVLEWGTGNGGVRGIF